MMSATALKCAEVPVGEYRNYWLVLLIHSSAQSKGQKLFSLFFCPFFLCVLDSHTATTLSSWFLSWQFLGHHSTREMLVIAWHVLEYLFLYLHFKLAAGFVGNIRNTSLSYNLSRLITENFILTL